MNSQQMEHNSSEKDQHAIKILEINQAHLAKMKEKISLMPKLLTNAAGQNSCCIFRVPHSQVQADRYAYYPNIISIGPYHYRKESLNMIQEHKWRFLATLLARTQSKGLGLEDYLKAIKPLEKKARECYSEVISLDSDEFVEMMVLDGCFIIEFFRIVGKLVHTDPDDPLFAMSWVFPFLLRDMVKLENQIPFFILESLFNLSKMPSEDDGPSLMTLALRSLDYVIDISDEVIEKYHIYYNHNVKHILDLLRSSFIPKAQLQKPLGAPKTSSQVIQCISKLRRAGIKFKAGESKSFLDIKFQRGVMEMPCLTVDDFTSSFLLNCVAFELCHKHCTKHITNYATLMDCLVDTYKDVEFLCDAGIIENYLGTDGDVSRFFNILGKDVIFDALKCHLVELFDDVNEYYRNNWHVTWASFKNTYFNTPWSFISALAAVVLLVLTIAQTFYTVYPFYRS